MDLKKEENKLYLQELIFEVTRKCNLECIHCFCGESENLDLSNEIIDKVLEQVRWTKNISLTGGEPMLAPQIVEHIVNEIIENRIKLLAFNCVVNGTIMDERAISFIHSFNKMATYINEHYRNDWGQDYSHDIAR